MRPQGRVFIWKIKRAHQVGTPSRSYGRVGTVASIPQTRVDEPVVGKLIVDRRAVHRDVRERLQHLVDADLGTEYGHEDGRRARLSHTLLHEADGLAGGPTRCTHHLEDDRHGQISWSRLRDLAVEHDGLERFFVATHQHVPHVRVAQVQQERVDDGLAGAEHRNERCPSGLTQAIVRTQWGLHRVRLVRHAGSDTQRKPMTDQRQQLTEPRLRRTLVAQLREQVGHNGLIGKRKESGHVLPPRQRVPISTIYCKSLKTT